MQCGEVMAFGGNPRAACQYLIGGHQDNKARLYQVVHSGKMNVETREVQSTYKEKISHHEARRAVGQGEAEYPARLCSIHL